MDETVSKVDADWNLAISLDKKSFAPGELIKVKIVFKNTSDKVLDYGAQGKDFDYVLDCRNDRDEKMPLTLFGKRMEENRGTGRYIRGQIAADAQLENELSLTRHVDLSLADKYSIVVAREVFPHEGNDQPPLVSNKVDFEINDP